jgi:antitoxin component YwqK of YwqJK toxin-antitoxin module
MINLLTKNIVEFVLNEYLDYEEDILKLKQFLLFKFNIKKHIRYEFSDFSEYNCPIKRTIKYLDDKKIKVNTFYADTNTKRSETHFKNEIKNGSDKYWDINGYIVNNLKFKNGIENDAQERWFNGRYMLMIKVFEEGTQIASVNFFYHE